MCQQEMTSIRLNLSFTYLSIVVLYGDLFLADSAPKLDGKLSDILLLALHTLDGKTEKGLLHVEAHLVVIQTHDTVQAAIRTLLDAIVFGLCRLTDDLHDVVPLAFIFKVGAHKLNRVAEGRDGSVTHIVVGLFLAGTLNNGCEDSIRVVCKGFTELIIISVADETDGGQGCLFLVIGTTANALDKCLHQLGPLVVGYFDGSDRGDELGSRLAGAAVCSGEGSQGGLLDILLDLGVQVEPALLNLT